MDRRGEESPCLGADIGPLHVGQLLFLPFDRPRNIHRRDSERGGEQRFIVHASSRQLHLRALLG
jgi:hypothetical protein